MTYRVETLLLSGHISTVLFDDQEQAEAQYKKIKDVIGIPSWKNDTAGEVTIDSPSGPTSYVVDKITSVRMIDSAEYNKLNQPQYDHMVNLEIRTRKLFQQEGVADVKS